MLPTDPDNSYNNAPTLGLAAKQKNEVSLGDEQTLDESRSGQGTVINDHTVSDDFEARYRVEGTLGQGGMGAVLLATDTRLDRKVAIKRILTGVAGDKTAVQRFLTEARAIAAINHPNIIQIYDYGQAKDGPFLTMEYVEGGCLLERCRERALPLDEAIAMACQLCDGLARVHDLGIIHRDIKPANVLLTKDGIPKLTDFGLAKAQASDHGQTGTGAVLGTPDFMPPEQRRDASLIDHRSDLWSLAATVYQMVTGRSPRIIRFDLLPAELAKVLGRALEDAKEQRFQSAREMRNALKTSLRTPEAVREFLAGSRAEDYRPAVIASVPVCRTVVCLTEAGILDVNAEGVCYSANNNLVFGDGVSGAVLRAAGPRLRQAAARIVRDEGPIPVGSCAVTDAYDLVEAGTRKIFHLATLALDPLRQRYEPRSKDYLGDISRVVASACHLAAEAGLGSLALPQLGTRVGGLSADEAAAAVVRGVHKFLLNDANNKAMEKLFLCAFHSDPALRALARQIHLIRCQSGDILDADTEAVVVSANNWLVGGSGTAKEAACRGGEELATAIEALQNQRCPLKIGTAVEFPSGRIQDLQRGHRKRLYYAISLGYHGFDGQRAAGRIPATPESVYEAVVTTLRMASACTVRSIAFPLMGARPGYSTVPEQAAPRVMLRTMVAAINDIRPELTMDRISIYLPPRQLPLAQNFVLRVAEGPLN